MKSYSIEKLFLYVFLLILIFFKLSYFKNNSFIKKFLDTLFKKFNKDKLALAFDYNTKTLNYK